MTLRPDVHLLIIDSDSTVGGVWSKDRLYPNLVAQVKHGLFNYTDTPMPRRKPEMDDKVTGDMIHDYLHKYANDHDLLRRTRFNTFVQRVSRCEEGWHLTCLGPQGAEASLQTIKLMVCTGVTSIPNMPALKTVDITVPIIHSRDLGVAFEALGKDSIQDVVVVGAAKSAYDAVYLLLSMGKRVTWLIRPDGAGPLAILPSELLGYFNSIGVASTRLMTYLSPSILNTKGTLYRFFQRTVIGRWCIGKIWDGITYLSDRHAGYSKGDHVAQLRPEVNRQRYTRNMRSRDTRRLADMGSVFWANSGLGVITLPDFWSKIHTGNVKIIRDNIDLVEQNTVVLRSGETLSADYIVMCTGWGDHFGMFDARTKAELGLPTVYEASPRDSDESSYGWEKYDMEADSAVNKKLPFLAEPPGLTNPMTNNVQPQRRWRLYRRSIPYSLAVKGDRSLAIMGQIHTVQTPLVSEVQSFWSILYLLGEINLPNRDIMAREIADWNAWTRKRYLSQGQKFPYSLYDFLPVRDLLLSV
ncbi:MAG: hypothetical protein Q9170_004825 [Blastenia crenularia]